MRWLSLSLTALLLSLLAHDPARAGFLYTFDQTNYTVAAGGTVDVQVFLTETGTSILADTGLDSAAVRVFFIDLGVSQPAQVLNSTDISANSMFDGPVSADVQSGTSAGLSEFVDIASPPVTTASGQILLGTFRFTAGSVGGEITHLQATDYDRSSFDTITDSGVVLDSFIADGSATITVSGGIVAPVPEPSTLVLLGMALPSFLGYACRRHGWDRSLRRARV